MKVSIIGSVNYDTIYPYKGESFSSFGGITYTILTIAKLCKECIVIPLINIGKNEKEEFLNLLSNFKNIKIEYIKEIEGTTKNILRYINPEERKENIKFYVEEIEFERIEPHLDSDAFLINFISPRDVSLKTLFKLRENFKGTIYMDVHSLIRKEIKGKLIPYYLSDWKEYAKCADIIQMNLEEMKYFTALDPSKGIDLISFLILNSGPKILNLTFGSKGVCIYLKQNDKLIKKIFEPEEIYESDVTGCGDVFGASFLVFYLKTKDPFIAGEKAVFYSSKKAKLKGILELIEYL
ncbi:MAG: carbohydrate kinase family protein [candidate division WOR-3 bacterium]